MKPWILITGAYGGMGKATANALIKKGFRVFAMDKAVEDGGEDLVPILADVTDEESVKKAFRTVSGMADSLFGIIHFAGIYMLDSLVEMGTDAFERIFRVNLEGAFLVNKTFLPLLTSGARILITTSELAPLDPLPFTGVYAITKGALDRYAYSLGMELQLLGIRVSVLRAGAVATDMLGVSTDYLDRFCQKTAHYSCNAERFKRIVEGVEARRVSPDAIAKKVIKILRKKRPRFAYSINRNPLLLLLHLLPRRTQLFVIRCVLRTR